MPPSNATEKPPKEESSPGGPPQPVNLDELKRLIEATMGSVRALPPRDYSQVFDSKGTQEPELAPQPPPKPDQPKTQGRPGEHDPTKGNSSQYKKKQSLKRQSKMSRH